MSSSSSHHDSSPPSLPDSPSDGTPSFPIVYQRRVQPLAAPPIEELGPRIRWTPPYLADYHHSSHVAHHDADHSICPFEALGDNYEDMTLREALAHPGWNKAIKVELNSLLDINTWTLIELPPNRHALFSRWVLRAKLALNPTQVRLKARLVAKGFEQ